jgi:hypothetical protein
MTATCHQLPPSVAEQLLQEAARSICDRPGESAAQRASRTHQMVHMILAMQPRDGLEYMLSILVVGHFNVILASMREFFMSQPETADPRSKSTIVALDRALLGMVGELRLSGKRRVANQAQETRPAATRNETAPSPESRTMADARPAPGGDGTIPSQPIKNGAPASKPPAAAVSHAQPAAADEPSATPPPRQAVANPGVAAHPHAPTEPATEKSAEEAAEYEKAVAAINATYETVLAEEMAKVAAGNCKPVPR